MRILLNFQNNDGWFISCLAEDCKTVIGPRLDVASLDTLRRLLRYAGANAEEMKEFEHSLGAWGKGSVWISNLTDAGAKLLRIRIQNPVQGME
jgi:hypothetical protein